MHIVRTSAFFLVLAGSVWAKLPLPNYVKPCSWKLSDKKLGECALKNGREVLKHVLDGDPVYNIPVLSPLHIDQLAVIDNEGPLGMKLICTNLKLRGIENFTLDNYAITRNPPQVTYLSTMPDILINTKYNVSGRILLLPIVGQGNGIMTLKNVKIAYQYDYDLKRNKEDGEVYFVIKPGAKLSLDADGLTVRLDNLFNGDNAILSNTNKFLNEEWQEVFASARPAFEKSISEIVTKILTGIFSQVPFKDAFLDVTAEDLAKATEGNGHSEGKGVIAMVIAKVKASMATAVETP